MAVRPNRPTELVLELHLKASPEQLFNVWTDASLLKGVFCPAPWYVSAMEMDARAGGIFNTIMNGPDGEVSENLGQFLVVDTNKRIMFTDAFIGDFVPSKNPPFFVGDVTFAPHADGGTIYVARANHWTQENCDAHKAMGFEQGWTIVAAQIDALALTL